MDGDLENKGLATEVLLALKSPLNMFLLSVCAYLLYKICRPNSNEEIIKGDLASEKNIEPMKKQDFTVAQLQKYDGTGKNGRILIAVNGKVFDVSKMKKFYGLGAAYGIFAGRDASRGLATFKLDKDSVKDEYDDLKDLKPSELDEMREWQMQFQEKYDVVGKLLKPGEEPTDYSDFEEVSLDEKKFLWKNYNYKQILPK